MTTTTIPIGAPIACDLRESSENVTVETRSPKTLDDLLVLWGENPPPTFPVLGTTCSLLAAFLEKPLEQITIDFVVEARAGFRSFLQSRKYAENSIRTYVNHVRILLVCAKDFGWKPCESISAEWRGVFALAAEKKCKDVALHLAGIRKTPREVTIEDVNRWVLLRVQRGLSYDRAKQKTTWFWRLLRDCGCTEQTPMCLVREKNYGVPLEQFPPPLKSEVVELLRWKQAEYAFERPKKARHRPVTAKRLQQVISELLGYVVNVRRGPEITSLSELVRKQIVGGFAEWRINERKAKGQTLQRNLRLLCAAMHQHPLYETLDLKWFKALLDGLPIEPKSQTKKRKAEKFLEYHVLEGIPVKIRAGRARAEKRGPKHVAQVVQKELLIKWLITLPWRQRNLRECRIGGSTPNLFKGKIPPFSDIDKPVWVQEEEEKNPETEFWQFHFTCDETKTNQEVHALLPRQLIGLLEEFLQMHRGQLVRGVDPGTLFLNGAGKTMPMSGVTRFVSNQMLRHAGRRVTPHVFRDIVAFAWLKAHAKDYLTLSKILWHANVNEVILTYGSRFNESSGVCGMESWLTDRESILK